MHEGCRPPNLQENRVFSPVRQAAGTSQEICRKSTYGVSQMGLFLEISRNGVDGNERVKFPSLA
ncbi:hypothetical protein HMPREF1979_00979 [Actinomyces johnsonii F0542]|uniref:Uncharacterized protein n=1 Tax=Actinomyces johnsonii F0542 TaxID=1321818 RepID=U1QTI2_9ACTO|nr:hypothetical protein HMPREF1979_00979 [Actinomyces johnsonii F0542]